MENYKFIAGFRRPAWTENFEADLPAASQLANFRCSFGTKFAPDKLVMANLPTNF
jgi:hypothetical protein